MKKIFTISLILFCLFNITLAKEVNVDIFWQNKEDQNYQNLIQELDNVPEVNVRNFDVNDEKNKQAMLVLVDYFKASLPATPFVVIGESAFVYFKPEHKSTLLANIANCKENSCADMTSKAFALLENPESKQAFTISPVFYITGFLVLITVFIVIKNLRKNKNEKNN